MERVLIAMPYVYILECMDGTYYTGSARDLGQRVDQHMAGIGANYTVKHPPVKLVYLEEFERMDEAFDREKQIQNWSHEKKKALIAGDIEKLKLKSKKDFSRKKNEDSLAE
jgi:putative endonuclease